MELAPVCKGKSLEQIWKSQPVKDRVRAIREHFQAIVNEWATRDKKRHLPVYVSLKPKMKALGLYFGKKRGGGSIVLFPIRALCFPVTSFSVLPTDQMLRTLEHEYAHHLTGTPHGNQFQQNLGKVRRG